jgi:uncharacterized protein (DUF2267 family)
MSARSVDAIERSVHKTNDWLSELAAELDEDREGAWRILKAYFQVLRDELTIDEAAQLAAQLPLPGPDDAARAAEAATKVLRDHVTEGELDDALSQLPTDVRDVLVHG